METAVEKISRVLAIAESQQAESIARLQRLVRIPSPTGEENEAQQHVATALLELGAEVTQNEPNIAEMFRRFPDVAQYPTHWQHDLILSYERLPDYESLRKSGLEDVLNYDGRPNVVGLLRGSGGGRSLVLNAHIDTVTVEPTGKWTHDPYGAHIVDDMMYGRGTSDMKGGLMAALMALHFLREAGVTLRGDVIFQSVVNEEHAGNGTLDLVRRGVKADAAIVLEPTDNSIFVSHPGGVYWQLTATGVQRSPGARWHEGVQQGVSAIETLPALLRNLLEVERSYNETASDDTSRPFSLVMGKIGGGHYETVTADEVVVKGGAYFSPQIGDVVGVMDSFRQAIKLANESDPLLRRCPAEFAFLHHDDSTYQADEIEPARHMGEVLRRHARDGNARLGPFCCDARHLVNQAAIPTIIFGPGSIAQAHKPDEHIPMADYLASIEYLIEFIGHWCNLDAVDATRNA
jgi:acetylornithine deacetylase